MLAERGDPPSASNIPRQPLASCRRRKTRTPRGRVKYQSTSYKTALLVMMLSPQPLFPQVCEFFPIEKTRVHPTEKSERKTHIAAEDVMLVDGLRDLQGLVGQGPPPATNSPRCHGRGAGRSFCNYPPLSQPNPFYLTHFFGSNLAMGIGFDFAQNSIENGLKAIESRWGIL
jgi:hypothetical protein